MNEPSIEQVEQAVRAVLAGRLAANRPTGIAGRRIFTGSLLSVKVLESLEDLGTELAVAPETVVTPLARDYLKKRGVVLQWISGAESGARATIGEWGFACELSTPTIETIRRRLLTGSEAWRELGTTSVEAAHWVVSAPGRGAVVLSMEASVAVWLANRVDGVRAAAPHTADGVSRAVQRLGANILVFEPRAHPPMELLSLMRVFRRAGAPVVPSSLEGTQEGATWHEDRRSYRPGDPLPRPPQPAECTALDSSAHAARGADRGFAEAWRGGRRL